MEDPSKVDYTLMKMLLSAPVSNAYETASSPPLNLGPLYASDSTNIPSPVSDVGDDSQQKLSTYFQQLSGTTEEKLDVIQLDHSYSKPWNWRPETSFMRPSKTLFINNKIQSQDITISSPLPQEDTGEINVVDTEPDPEPIYELDRAKRLMDECETYSKAARLQDNEDWEDTIVKDSWNNAQHRLFNKMMRIIQNDRLGRLVYENSWNEPVLRRAVVDKAAKRTRYLLSSIDWEPKLIQWLHSILVDNLNGVYLACYLDILQALKSKVPTLIDKMMFGPNSSTKFGLTSNENLFPLLKRAWDPVAQSLMQHKAKKLPGNPILLIVPSSPNFRTSQSRRLHNWITLLNQLGMVVVVHTSLGNSGSRLTMTNCLDQMVVATRAKLQEVRTDCPGRPIILVGFNTGGALACQIAEMEAVSAVVSLGFPLCTVEGPRGEPDDMLMELQVPVLFVIGQCALTATPADIEDLREHMRVETGLIIVGSADDYLRVSMRKRKMDGITQSMVDRCIVDEIGDFVGSILISPFPPQLRQSPVYAQPVGLPESSSKKVKGIKRRTSTGSETVDSEPPSPQPKKIPRPVGRPPKDGKYSKAQRQKMQQMYQNPDQETTYNPIATPVRSIPKHTVMANNPIVKTVSKILSTADALRNSNSIDVVNEAVANILAPSSSVGFSGIHPQELFPPPTIIPTKFFSSILTPSTDNDPPYQPTIKTNVPRPYMDPTKTQVKYLPKSALIRAPLTQKQLAGLQPHQRRHPVLNPRFKPPMKNIINEVPGPADLSGTNILDIPIIFADNDGSLLSSEPLTQNKVVLVNKPRPQVLTAVPQVRPVMSPQTPPLKYTKIILAKRPATSSAASPTIPFESVDVEQQIKASTLTRPVQAGPTIINSQIITPKLDPSNDQETININ